MQLTGARNEMRDRSETQNIFRTFSGESFRPKFPGSLFTGIFYEENSGDLLRFIIFNQTTLLSRDEQQNSLSRKKREQIV